jgi:hypothetical protein
LGTREIAAGIATSVEDAWWAADRVLARTKAGPDAGEDDVVIDGWRRALRPPVLLRSFWAKAEDDIWAVGDLGRVYHFDGTNWTDARLVFNGAPLMANLTAISGTSTGELLIVGDGVALRRRAP